jgi:large subunit ribosomal protein L1
MSLNTKNILEAIKKAKETSKKRNFVQSVELIVNLKDLDPKKPESKLQELIELPHSLGEGNKICVVASGELASEAKKAGADSVVQSNELEAMAGDKKKKKQLAKTYDFFIAEAPLMPLVGRILGASLGPRGKMPTPVPPTANITAQLKKHRKTILVRTRGQLVIQCRVGTEKMPDEKITENVQAIMRRIEGKLKRGIKNIRSIYLKSTMGQPVKVKL